ncbi:MAG TPA: ROK family protein [Firmicutes bacterium]|nr:ROK family protein [Bacillota bacterium]
MPPFAAGIDLGGTNIAAGVADLASSRLVSTVSRPTGRGRPWEAIARDMAAAVREAAAAAGLDPGQLAGVGVGIPGTCDQRGTALYVTNLGWTSLPLGPFLSRELGLPVRLSNDANCAVLAEGAAGAAVGYRDVAMVTIGTGLGSGFLIGGRLFEGGWGAGAEMGHMVIRSGEGPVCNCGRQGCWEVFASATALIRQTREAAEANPHSLLWQQWGGKLDQIDGRTAFDAAAQGDPVARQVVDRYLWYLGEGLVSLVNIFRPQILLLGGGVSAQGEALLAPLRRRLAEDCYAGSLVPIPRLAVAALGNDAGILGAALLLNPQSTVL